MSRPQSENKLTLLNTSVISEMLKQVGHRASTFLTCSTPERPQLHSWAQHGVQFFKTHVDHPGKIWMWTEWGDQEKNRNLENVWGKMKRSNIICSWEYSPPTFSFGKFVSERQD